MIVEGLLNVALSCVFGLFSLMEVVKLPVEIMGVLTTILQYGVWVVGADIMALVFATVTGWWTIKLTVGLAVFIWELLPLT